MTIRKLSFAFAAWLCLAFPVFAQNAPEKVNQPWFMLARLTNAVNVTSSSAATALPAKGLTAWLVNTGSSDAYYALGTANTVSTTSSAGDYLKAGSCVAVDLYPIGQGISGPYTYIAMISAGGTTVTIETGVGQPPCVPATVSVSVGAISVQASATGGASTAGEIVPANTTGVSVKGSAGTIYGVQLGSIGSTPVYLKIYDTATAPTCGSGTPIKRLIIPAASTAANGAGSNVTFGTAGIVTSSGIGYCVTGAIADNDTTNPTASSYLVNIDYK